MRTVESQNKRLAIFIERIEGINKSAPKDAQGGDITVNGVHFESISYECTYPLKKPLDVDISLGVRNLLVDDKPRTDRYAWVRVEFSGTSVSKEYILGKEQIGIKQEDGTFVQMPTSSLRIDGDLKYIGDAIDLVANTYPMDHTGNRSRRFDPLANKVV